MKNNLSIDSLFLAERIFKRISQSDNCDIIVYNTMLVCFDLFFNKTKLCFLKKGYLQNQKAEQGLAFWDKVHSQITPDNVTYILLLNGMMILL